MHAHRKDTRLSGCTKPVPFLEGEFAWRSSRPAAFKTRRAPTEGWSAGTTDRHDVVVEHHEGQAAITIEWMGIVVVEDGLLFPVLEPSIAWNLAVVLVGLAVACFPIVKLARAEPQSAQQAFGGQFRANYPVAHVIDDFVANVVRNPAALSSPPLAFLP